MVDSTALVGSARVGSARVGSLGDTAPEYFRSGGSWWKLIHDPQIGITEQQIRDWAAQDAQDKADAAQAEAIRLADVAATEADEALEAALGDMVADKSNVFIQDTAPVAEMQRPGVLWIDTSPVTVDGAQVPGNVPKTWDDALAQWVAVTDSAVVQASAEAAAAHQAAQEAADAAGEAMAEARYAPRIAQRPPTQADGVDKPAGAGWLEYATTTNYQGITDDRLVQQWMWTGTTWVRLDMDPTIIPVIQIGTGTFGDLTGDRITVTGLLAARMAEIIELSVEHLTVTDGATISEAVAIAISGATLDYQEAYLHNLRVDELATIDEAVIGALAANIITSGLFRTAESGQRLEIDSNGLIMWGVDPDGVEYEMVRLGPSGENLLTVGDTTISPAGVQAPAGSFGDLAVGGRTLDELLADLPRGMVAWGKLAASSQLDGDTSDYARRGEIQTALQAGRLYRIRLSEHFVEVDGGTNTNLVEELRYSFNGDPIYHGLTPSAGNYQGAFSRSPVFAGSATTVNGMEFMLDTGSWSTGRGFWLMWMMRTENAGRPVRVLATGFYSPVMSVEDMGPSMPSTLKRWNDGDGGGSTDPDPIVVRRTTTWDHGGYGGDTSAGDVVQGYYSGVGMRSGSWRFPSALKTALAGATIEKFEVYLYASHWWYGSGGTASIRATDGAYKGFWASPITSANWPRNAGRWVTVPSSWHANIANGSVGGIGVDTSSTSSLYYGRFSGSATRFRATYRK